MNLETDAFAGQDAAFEFMLRNAVRGRSMRHRDPIWPPMPRRCAASGPGGDERVTVCAAAPSVAGYSTVRQFELRTRYPFGWFRAWTYVQGSLSAFVAPQPHGERRPPAAASGRLRPRSEAHGDEDFAGLRPYSPGIPLKHMAWKVLARGGDAAVRTYAGMAAQPEWLEWSALEGLDPEARLSQLCRWVSPANAGFARPYGLRMPGIDIALDAALRIAPAACAPWRAPAARGPAP